MSVKISLIFLISIYIAFCLGAMLAKRGGGRVLVFLYALFCLFLTLPSVKIGRFVGISFSSCNASQMGLDLSFNNIALNVALTFPLGLAFRSMGKGVAEAIFFGTAFGGVIEILQLALPTGRVVDFLDVLLCALGSLCGYVQRGAKRKRSL